MEDNALTKKEKRFLRKYNARKIIYLLFSIISFVVAIVFIYFSYKSKYYLISRIWRTGSLCSLAWGLFFLGIIQTENIYYKIISKIK